MNLKCYGKILLAWAPFWPFWLHFIHKICILLIGLKGMDVIGIGPSQRQGLLTLLVTAMSPALRIVPRLEDMVDQWNKSSGRCWVFLSVGFCKAQWVLNSSPRKFTIETYIQFRSSSNLGRSSSEPYIPYDRFGSKELGKSQEQEQLKRDLCGNVKRWVGKSWDNRMSAFEGICCLGFLYDI